MKRRSQQRITQEGNNHIQHSKNQRDDYTKSKSCILPNTQPLRVHQVYDDKAKIEEASKESSQQVCLRMKTTLAILFIFCFLLYCYIVLEPKIKPEDMTKIEKHTESEDCFLMFKRNNCTLQQPVGQLCQQLHKCILKTGLSQPPPSFSPSANKIQTVQEVLQNFILLLGGMGFYTFYKKLKSLPQNSRDYLSKLRDIITPLMTSIFGSLRSLSNSK